jgi:hypothetical protein
MNEETVFDFTAPRIEVLKETFESCRCSLFVYRVLGFHRKNQYNDILGFLGSTSNVKFEMDQSNLFSRVCFSAGYGIFNRESLKRPLGYLVEIIRPFIW